MKNTSPDKTSMITGFSLHATEDFTLETISKSAPLRDGKIEL